MPGVLPPNNEYLISRIGELFNRVRAIETQQQGGYTNGLGQLIITTGLVPGSDPPEWGFQLLDPTTGQRVALFGEDASGNVQLDITGEQTVTGTETVTGALNVSGTETVSGTLNVTGNAIIGGTLSLPNGIINNAALANPTAFDRADYAVNSTSLASSMSTIASTTIAVPSGFTQAAVMVSVEVGATAGASASGINARAYAGGTAGDTISATFAPGYAMSVPASVAVHLTGLSGSITVAAQGNYFGAAPNAGSADAHVAALAIFAR